MAWNDADGAEPRGPGSRTPLFAFVVLSLCLWHVPATHAQLLTVIGTETGTEAGDGESIAVHRDWTMRCEAKAGARQTCSISTHAAGTGANGNAIRIALSGEKLPTGAPLFHFVLPLDLLIVDGVEMRFAAGTAFRLAYRSCHATGCIVPFRLSQELETRFRRDLDFTLRAFEVDGSGIDIPVSLAGFAAAFTALAR